MQDRPDAAALIAAVAAFLEQELLPTIGDQRLRFRGLVAANLLAIVRRELQAGDAPLYAEYTRLAALLGATDAPPENSAGLRRAASDQARKLCDGIRRGEYDDADRFDSALRGIEESLIAKLRIANPRLLDRRV